MWSEEGREGRLAPSRTEECGVGRVDVRRQGCWVVCGRKREGAGSYVTGSEGVGCGQRRDGHPDSTTNKQAGRQEWFHTEKHFDNGFVAFFGRNIECTCAYVLRERRPGLTEEGIRKNEGNEGRIRMEEIRKEGGMEGGRVDGRVHGRMQRKQKDRKEGRKEGSKPIEPG